MKNLNEIFSEIVDWSNATFPGATHKIKAIHLSREATELTENQEDESEIADCLFLLAHLADGLNVNLAEILETKLELNKNRKWGTADANGVVEHVRLREITTVYFSTAILVKDEQQAGIAMSIKRLISGRGYAISNNSCYDGTFVNASPSRIFKNDCNNLLASSFLVADVTDLSIGVGYEIAMAIANKIPVLCLSRSGFKVSAMISGNPNLRLRSYNSLQHVSNILDEELPILYKP